MTRHKIFCLMLCSVAALAQAQQSLTALNSPQVEYAPMVSNDGQYLVFQSNRDKGFRLYESKKKDSVWGEAIAIEAINSSAGDLAIIGSPFFSAEGSTLFYAAVFEGTYGDLDLYFSTRRKESWSKPEHLPFTINSKLPETSPSISNGGDTLFFIRKGTDGTNPTCGKVFFSVKGSDEKWSEAAVLPVTQSTCFNRLQQTYANGYYWNDDGNKQQVLETANPSVRKAKALSDFIPDNGRTSWITPKEDQLVYAFNGDIYSMPLAYNTHIKGTSFVGKVKDNEKGMLLAADFSMVDAAHSQTSTMTSAATGDYKLYVPSGYTYEVRITADKYDTLVKKYAVAPGDWFSIKTEDIILQRRKKKMVFNVSDKDNGKNLKVKVKVTNKTTGEELLLDENMQQDGRYTIHLREGDEYSVEVNNLEGYAFTKRDFNSNDENTEDISIPISKIKTGTSLEIHDIYFDFNSYKLSKDSFTELDDLVQWMKTNEKVGVQIEAHTDDVGSEDFNRNLSEKRAKEIVAYLSKKGIAPARMKAKGFGKSKPRMEGDSEEARAKNRRVELTITSLGN